MIDLFFKLLILPVCHFLILWYRDRFRRSIQPGDIVGIDFGGENVQNREVVYKLHDGVVVQASSGNYMVTIKYENVFLPDHRFGNFVDKRKGNA